MKILFLIWNKSIVYGEHLESKKIIFRFSVDKFCDLHFLKMPVLKSHEYSIFFLFKSPKEIGLKLKGYLITIFNLIGKFFSGNLISTYQFLIKSIWFSNESKSYIDTWWPKSKVPISNYYNSETNHFWPHVGKAKMRLRGGFLKNCKQTVEEGKQIF